MEKLFEKYRSYMEKDSLDSQQALECLNLAGQFFEQNAYEATVGCIAKVLNCGYTDDSISEFLSSNFLQPNLQEFFETNEKTKGKIGTNPPDFQDLTLRFIPVSEDIYFMWDTKNNTMPYVVNISAEELNKTEELTGYVDYFDVLYFDKTYLDVKEILGFLNNRRKVYALAEGESLFALCQIPGMWERVLRKITIFQTVTEIEEYFRIHKGCPLPYYLLYDKSSGKADKIEALLQEIHEYRLTGEGRDNSNILFSIAIPSYNRGKLALRSVLSLLRLPMDNDIEIIVSNNGSAKGKEEYNLIKNYPDSRIHYFEFEENQLFEGNFWKVLSLARGKYVMLMSDEEIVVNDSVAYYMDLVRRKPYLGIIRSKSELYYFVEDKEYPAGDASLSAVFGNNGYMSGVIYKTEKITNQFIEDFRRKYKNNEWYKHYPHLCLDAILAKDYTYRTDEVINHACGEPESYQEIQNNGLYEYATWESRIKQMFGKVEILQDCKIRDAKIKIVLLKVTFDRTFKLCSVSKGLYTEDFPKVCSIIKEKCFECLEQISWDGEESDIFKIYLRESIERAYQEYKEMS